MADTSSRMDPAHAGDPPEPAARKPARRRRGLRVVLLSLGSLVVLIGAAVVGGYAYVNHEAGSIHRVPVKFTKMSVAGAAGGMTILVTSQASPTGSASSGAAGGGLILLLHINASQKAGGVVSISPQTEVNVPGHGRKQLAEAQAIGGPTLLVKTLQSATGVPIDHYARIDFGHATALINALGGVTVTLPDTTTSSGHLFRAGPNQVNGITAVDYARQSSLTEQERVLRQQNLLRAMLTKLAQQHLLTHPVTAARALPAITSMLTVDSNFSNSQVEKLATRLGILGARSSTFVTAPVTTTAHTVTLDQPAAGQLWNAMNHDSLAAFAQQHPATVTPAVVK